VNFIIFSQFIAVYHIPGFTPKFNFILEFILRFYIRLKIDYS